MSFRLNGRRSLRCRTLEMAAAAALCMWFACTAAAWAQAGVSHSRAQTGVVSPQTSPQMPGNPVPNADMYGETDGRAEHLRQNAREQERQKRMVDDANRLVALTSRYRANVSEHGSPTAEDARMLLDIEKLARSVKDRMRGM